VEELKHPPWGRHERRIRTERLVLVGTDRHSHQIAGIEVETLNPAVPVLELDGAALHTLVDPHPAHDGWLRTINPKHSGQYVSVDSATTPSRSLSWATR
jgi:hypothetical protein